MAKAPVIALPKSKFDIALVAGKLADAVKASGSSKSGMLLNVPVAAIKVIPGFNVRALTPEYTAHRDEIAASILANGFYETMPLAGFIAKEGDTTSLFLTGGHTRFDAVQFINANPDLPDDKEIKTVPMIVRGGDTSLEDLTVALHTENNGAKLKPIELGTLVKRLLTFPNATQESVAGKLGISARYLRDVLMLVDSHATIKAAVLAGSVSSTQAISLLKNKKDGATEAVADLVKAATAKGKTRATAKDAATTTLKMKKTALSISMAAGMDIKEIVKAAASLIRSTLGIPGEGNVTTDGSISLVISVPDVPAPEAVEAAKKTVAAPKASDAAIKKAAAAAKKPAKTVEPPVVEAEQNNDQPVPNEDEPLIVPPPPAVKSGAGVPETADEDDGDI